MKKTLFAIAALALVATACGQKNKKTATDTPESKVLVAYFSATGTSSRPAIVKGLNNLDKYETVYVGFPVWWYTAPTIINTFLDTYDLSGKTVIFFATSGGSDLKKANAQFKEQYPSLNWKDGQTLNGASKEDIAAWVNSHN